MLAVQIVGLILTILGIILILARALAGESNVIIPGVTIKAPTSVLVLVLGVLVFLFPVSPWWPVAGNPSASPAASPSLTPTPTPSPTPTPTPSPTPTPTEQALCVPRLIMPADDAVLDNGRTDGSDTVTWAFSWTACPEADAYELFVIHPPSTLPVVDRVFNLTNYTRRAHGSYVIDANRFGWTWKVRARSGGQWGNWSAIRTFDVEPVNTD